jgi:hypothetical protein
MVIKVYTISMTSCLVPSPRRPRKTMVTRHDDANIRKQIQQIENLLETANVTS